MYSRVFFCSKVQVLFWIDCWLFFGILSSFLAKLISLPPHFLPKGLKTGFLEACEPVTSDLFLWLERGMGEGKPRATPERGDRHPFSLSSPFLFCFNSFCMQNQNVKQHTYVSGLTVCMCVCKWACEWVSVCIYPEYNHWIFFSKANNIIEDECSF